MTNFTDEEMKRLGEHIENYMNEFFSSIIIPDDEYEKISKNFKEAKKRTEELVEKLKKGKRSVFQADDD